MKKILEYLKPYIGRMVFGFIIKAAGAFCDLGLPWVLAYIIDDVIPTGSIPLILIWGVVMLILSVGARTGNIIANRMAARVASNTVRVLRHDLFWKIEQLSGRQVDQFSIPSLVSRMTSDTYNIHHMIGMMQRLGVRAPLILIGGIIITITLEPVLTLVLVGILPILAIIVYVVSKKGIPLFTISQKSIDKLLRTVRENITGIRVVKALSKMEYEENRFVNVNDEVVSKELKAGTTMAIINPTMNLLLNVGLTLVVVVGAYRVNLGASEVGKIVAFLSYFTMILNAMLGITRIFTSLSKASASAARISEVLTTEEDLIIYSENIYPTQKDEYHIEFDNVSFAYNKKESEETTTSNEDESDQSLITNINFKIKKGESLGIIGATGAGKTTIVNLLMRYYDIDDGAIRINGKDIRTLSLQELRRQFGVVFQNDSIFADTIRENIDLSRGLSENRIKEAAIDAQASEYIEQLGISGVEELELFPDEQKDITSIPNGKQYDYPVAFKGANLSGGQKQRLLIARALAGNPEILILDDSSSALDYKTDSNLRKAIRNHYQGITNIIIAQRISSIMHMDHILVMDDGKMIGYGNHDELIKSCDLYREIHQSQMGNG